MNKREVMIYTRYERFWHWSQAILIFTLFFTGLRVHGSHELIPFGLAVNIHTWAAIALMVLWVFTTFWNFTTGQWRQYLFKKGIMKVIRFYAYGILVGEPHPYKKSLQRKQNALQSLAYMTFMTLIGPALWLTGILYLLYNLWSHFSWSGEALWVVALLHTAAAFAMGTFVVIHVYMTTTGKTPLHYVKTMITGYDAVELSEVEEAYLKETKAADIR
ncbi:cytochrome b/b6 domain-containing protein [Magnetospirillum aberrantis]|uniref:Cytochrome B n=1 Tax=Magnetospirillum aberrantis SpK TaxID=908842 RepID=A0A7C9QRM3_9PROT|nr:cytochrome b/b6 domain-containing protein [Magnetospirillum aberrantis]NFV78920.1 cytochrome B [Magnetospirillum aberrantis SpK]